MDIRCDNCAYEPSSKCGRNLNGLCLGKKGKYTEYRGFFPFNYYNHFKPKVSKMALMSEGTTSYYSGKPNKVEYKHTGKSLTAREVIANSHIDKYELQKFAKFLITDGYGMETNLFGQWGFLEYALKHNCFRDFILKDGYIEPVEDKWVSPKIGDEFRGKEEKLEFCRTGETAFVLIVREGVDKGNRWNNPVRVNDPKDITKAEFQQICGSIPIDELERI